MIRSREKDGCPPIEITCFFEQLPTQRFGMVSYDYFILFIGNLINDFQFLVHLYMLLLTALPSVGGSSGFCYSTWI